MNGSTRLWKTKQAICGWLPMMEKFTNSTKEKKYSFPCRLLLIPGKRKKLTSEIYLAPPMVWYGCNLLKRAFFVFRRQIYHKAVISITIKIHRLNTGCLPIQSIFFTRTTITSFG